MVTSAASRGVDTGRAADTRFFGHPRGLSVLFFTEMWERFSYYGMRALLILFMTAPIAGGGLGFDAATAGAIYGLYTAMVYMAALPGGWIADRLIGQQRAVLYGGILIASGHFSMAVPSLSMFYLGLLLIVVGTGLLKGNVSVIVGRLYTAKDGRRDAGFSIFYMGINIGAALSPIVCGYLGQRVDWHLGFAAAGIGMVLGLIQFMLGRKHLGEAGLRPADPGSSEAAAALRRRASLVAGGVVAAIVLFVLGQRSGTLSITATQVSDAAGYFLLFLSIAFFAWVFLSSGWTREERGRLIVICALFLGYAAFGAIFEQAGSTLNLFADRGTSNTLLGFDFPSSWFQSANAVFVITFAPVFAALWVSLSRQHREPSTAVKFGWGLLLTGAGFAILVPPAGTVESGGLVSPAWLTMTYLLHTWGELAISPVGLSAMTKLAPARIGGLVMGVWFLGLSVGNYVGGRVGGLYESFALPPLFTAVAAFGIVAGLLFFMFKNPLTRFSGDAA